MIWTNWLIDILVDRLIKIKIVNSGGYSVLSFKEFAILLMLSLEAAAVLTVDISC